MLSFCLVLFNGLLYEAISTNANQEKVQRRIAELNFVELKFRNESNGTYPPEHAH
jgi:hypothetical protein